MKAKIGRYLDQLRNERLTAILREEGNKKGPHEVDIFEQAWMRENSSRLPRRPNFKIFYYGDGDFAATATSLKNQTYPFYTNCKDFAECLDGEWAVFIKKGDTLRPNALFEFAMKLSLEPELDLIYSDEEVTDNGRIRLPFYFKPDWSPDLLLSSNYIGSFFAVRAEKAAGAGINEGDLPYGALLKLTEAPLRIGHVAQVLFKSSNRGNDDGDILRLKDSLKRRGVAAEVQVGKSPGLFSIRRQISGNPMVSIIIPTALKDKRKFSRCIESIINKTSYPEYEIIFMDNSRGRLSLFLKNLPNIKGRPVKALPFEKPFNWSTANNEGARVASGDYLLFLNDDVEVITPDWIEALLENAQRPEVGAVGAKLIFADGKIQHAGVAFVDYGGYGRHIFSGFDADSNYYFGWLSLQRNCTAVTGAAMMVRKDVFNIMGGFDENLILTCNDTDFCLRLGQISKLIVWTPHALLVHHESISRGRTEHKSDIDFFSGRWRSFVEKGDPLYNPNLTLDADDLSLNYRMPVIEGRNLFAINPQDIKKLLIIKLDHLGDVVLSFPAISRLRQKFPEAEFTVLAGPWAREIFRKNPNIDKILTLDFFDASSSKLPREIGKQGTDRLSEELSGMGFNLAIDLRRNEETRHFLKICGTDMTAGFDRSGKWSLTFPLKYWDEGENMALQLIRLVESLPAGPNYGAGILDGFFEKKIPGAVREFFETTDASPLIGIHPEVGSHIRKWPEEYFGRLADLLVGRLSARLIFFGGSEAAPVAERIISGMKTNGNVISAAGILTLEEFMSAVSFCDFFVGNVSGPMYFASAVGTPTLGIFSGVVSPQEWSPPGMHVTVRLDVPCSKCDKSAPEYCQYDLKCLRQLNPEHAYKAFMRLMALGSLYNKAGR